MKALKVLILVIVSTILGAYLLGILAYEIFEIPEIQTGDDLVNLAHLVYGAIAGGILGAATGLILGLKFIKSPKK